MVQSHGKPLRDFGHPNFDIVAKKADLRSYKLVTTQDQSSSNVSTQQLLNSIIIEQARSPGNSAEGLFFIFRE